MKNEKAIRIILAMLMLVLGGMVVYYFWTHEELNELKVIPMPIMAFALVYTLLQMLKRYLFKNKNWWDWIYYIGLLTVILPKFLATTDNLSLFISLTTLGSLCLIIPILLDGKEILKMKRK